VRNGRQREILGQEVLLEKLGLQDAIGGIMVTWAYVFISSRQPKKVLRAVRKIDGVIHADALFGTPDVVAIVTGPDIAAMDAVIDQIADVPDVIATDSKVARWLDEIGPPRPASTYPR
jgi:Lrp/AsnC ligand binding domain